MEKDFQFAKIICKFLVFIPKLAFESRRKVNYTGDQITVKEASIGGLDRRILVRFFLLKSILECDRVDVQDGILGSFFTRSKCVHHVLQWQTFRVAGDPCLDTRSNLLSSHEKAGFQTFALARV